jgi:mono/diheme cytochrome c family protein
MEQRDMGKTTYVIGAFLFLAAFGQALAQSRADIRRGQTVARTICADCHAVENTLAPSPNPDAPSFRSVAERPGMNSLGLFAAIRTPHPEMPELVPDIADRDAVIDYILSLLPEE